MENRNKMKMSPKPKTSVNMRTMFVYASVSLTIVAVVTWLTFLSLNMGNTENAYAAPTTYNSKQNGNWNVASTWTGGSAPAMTNFADIANINSAHQVTVPGNLDIKNGAQISIFSGAKLTINGNMIVQNNLILTVIGQLVVNGNIEIKNGANITVTGSGALTATGNVELQNNANFTVDGTMNIGGNMSFGSNPSFNGSGTVNIIGNGCSNWTGTGSCNDNTTLPVQLISFVVARHSQGVKISWKTASEENNDFFTIEKSSDGISFSEVGEVNGNGTVKTVSSYEFIDEQPSVGRSYYRLTQTDYDGKSETFKPAMIEIEGSTSEGVSFNVYPNPFTGSTLTVNLSQPVSGAVEVLDGKGNKVFSQSTPSERNEMQLSLNENLQPGLYYVNLHTSGGTKTIKVMKR